MGQFKEEDRRWILARRHPNPRSSIDDDDFDYNDGIAAVASVEGPV
jgi:hypothetical protein